LLYDDTALTAALELAKRFPPAELCGLFEQTARKGLAAEFGGRPVLAWSGAPQGSSISLPFEVEREDRYAVRITAHAGPDGGRFSAAIDAGDPVELDFRCGELEERDLALGTHELGAGAHTLTFEVQEPGELWVELLSLLRLPPAAERPLKGEGEAHFIRLGIGRAAYAYRLAYGEVPPSLQALADCGIMPERYLRDENGVPLRCRRDGESLLVEAPNWTRAFFGLDARR
jgi:hypothetical protein